MRMVRPPMRSGRCRATVQGDSPAFRAERLMAPRTHSMLVAHLIEQARTGTSEADNVTILLGFGGLDVHVLAAGVVRRPDRNGIRVRTRVTLRFIPGASRSFIRRYARVGNGGHHTAVFAAAPGRPSIAIEFRRGRAPVRAPPTGIGAATMFDCGACPRSLKREQGLIKI